jgi:hypothetical protein
MMTRDRSTRFAERLEGLVRRSRRMVLGHGSARTTAVGGGALLAAAWAVGAGPRSEGFLAWGLTLSLVLVIVLAVRNWLVAPLSALRSGRAVARRLEERGGFGNILVGAEEALRLPDRWPGDDPVRRELRRRLFERAEGILDVVGPADVEPPRHRRGWLAAATTVLILAVAYLTLAPSEFGTGLTRLATPWPDNVTVVTGGLYGIKGDGFVVAGGDVNLAALDFAAPDLAGGPGKAVCEIRSGRGLWQPLPTMGVPVHGDQPGLPARYRRWTAGVEDVHEDFSWRFRRGSLVSAEHTIRVRQYPLVTALAARVVPPAYTKVPVQDLARLPVR